ncbi:PTS sugar transporter subunit IIA [Mammaliicoccus sciuri]|nr:PTS sugar transporter subunit IIA [Mammaliicoccus sciuri]
MEKLIQLTANPLVRMKYVDPLYVDKMHAAFDDTYMVINQNIAIPHADGDQVVHRTAMSMLILKEPLELSTGLKVHIFVAIAATDKFKHLRPLLQLRDMSQDDEAYTTNCSNRFKN